MSTSRLIVKNLPNSATDAKVRELFGTKGQVTDVQLKYTPDGKFRHFGFVGYNNSEDAAKAKEYFHNTYFGASKIQVEECSNLGDVNKPRAWSKYAAEKTEKLSSKKKKLDNDDNDAADEDGDEPKPKKKKKKEEEILEKCKEDPTFVEFLESHLKKSNWGNDTIVQDLESQLLGKDSKKKNKDVSKALDFEQEQEQAADDNNDEHDSKKKKKSSKTKGEKMKDEKVEGEEDNKDKSKTKEDRKKVLPEKEYFTIKLRNLPKKARKKDLKAFFAPLSLKSIRLPPKFRGIAYLGFATEKDMTSALYKNKGFLLGNQISVRKYESTKSAQVQAETKKNRWADQQALLENEAETVGESGRIFIRNLSYGTNEDDIRTMFEAFGPVTEVHLPIDRITRQLKGFGFVSFLLPEHATKAFNELDGSVFHGRMLHLLPAKSKEEVIPDDVNQAGSSYKKSKELALKKKSGSTHNWNTLFLGQNAVAEVAADRYNVTKEELLLDNNDERDKSIASVAVRMALAETEIVTETKRFLENNDVFLGAFEGSYVKAPRSTTCMLVKNLPPKTNAQELNELFSKHGVVGRIILPPSGITAIVEFVEPAEARSCFKKLAYSKFKNLPLYLEWAPVNIFGQQQKTEEKTSNGESQKSENNTDSTKTKTSNEDSSSNRENDVSASAAKEESSKAKLLDFDYDMIPEPDTTLFVKNLNFSTTEPIMKKHFEESGPVYSVTIAKKRDAKNPGNMLSQGYGFVQFFRALDASNALKNQQNGMLENHCLELKRSNRTLQAGDETQRKGVQSNEKGGTKILARNVPFLASKEEIVQLFKTFGELKAVRLPMKLDGSGEHRGFVFIEFHTKDEAKKAFETLSKSTHLYGRRLVLEWASQDETVDDLRAKTAKKFDVQTRGALDASRPKTKKMMQHYEETQQKNKKQQSDSEEDE